MQLGRCQLLKHPESERMPGWCDTTPAWSLREHMLQQEAFLEQRVCIASSSSTMVALCSTQDRH